ncbi:hypothetical protein ARMGADRAFT_41809 [Armillaria gallica]|uniref:Uncharacterized protein n=1 Tax=Armillaria gallica TaxID=47427 RepID=A0A2H3EUK8_ARMGA|nr:hypothetical protein ARMGADRAFT_41809 [Armillaria gallica]
MRGQKILTTYAESSNTRTSAPDTIVVVPTGLRWSCWHRSPNLDRGWNLDTQPILGRRRGALVYLSSTAPKDSSTSTATASSTARRITHQGVTRGVTIWLTHCTAQFPELCTAVQCNSLSCVHVGSPVVTGIYVQLVPL